MPTKTREQMMDSFAKLDYDGDEAIALSEMVEFERGRQNEESLLLVGIYWIGHALQVDFDQELIEGQKLLVEEEARDDSKFVPHYEMTSRGQPICINEYATEIAEGKHTHVIHIDDWDQMGTEAVSEDHIDH